MMATKKIKPATIAAVKPDAALIAAAEKEHALFLEAEKDASIVAVAGITNGMPADEIKRRILRAAGH